MRIQWGVCHAAKQKREHQVVEWDNDLVVNGHFMICGMSGSGKTHLLRKLIQELISSPKPPRVHIFDVHSDIVIPGQSKVLFSEQTDYGLNPLRINPDPHFGGVRKRVQGFIGTINKVMHKLGSKQESVLRNVLMDVYARFGFRQDEPSTWCIDDSSARLLSDGADGKLYLDVPIAEKDMLKDLKIGAQYDRDLRCWWIPQDQYTGSVTRWSPKTLARTHPSIDDVLRYTRHRMQMSFLGTGIDAITNLEILNKAAMAYQRKLLEQLRKGEKGYEDEKLQGDIDKARERAIESYTSYANTIGTGLEFNDLLKYDSTDVLKSVTEKLENLSNIGIFKPTPPPFDPNVPVHNYDIRPLSLVERRLFVLFKLEDIFANAVARGETKDLVEIIVLDEAHIYQTDDDDSILDVMIREIRKFGVGIVLASQSPTHFSEDIFASVATKVILGIDEMYWPGAARKMRASEDALQWVQPRTSMLIQMKTKAATKNEWQRVVIE